MTELATLVVVNTSPDEILDATFDHGVLIPGGTLGGSNEEPQ